MEKKLKEITLRNFCEDDINDKVRIINDDNNNKYLHYDLPLEYEKTLNWFNNNKNNLNRLDLTILYKDEVAGFIGLLGIDKKNKKAEFYICIDNKFSGKGIGSISTQMILDYAFNEMELNKIYLFTEKDNVKAQHLFEKMNFLKEGLLKDDIIFNNHNVSRYVYGLCKDDYYV